ncbi:PHP domain-containing protein [Collinsella sp. An2]|uniref:PHP domain-containing protein n=1 Tax=Collinsella sp. An2 TaxID=1965585 RepID=UPI000B576D09|nr:PHP domain-containing protein [Collinsella sp. An2]OUP07423.1 hypothetical protein B5F33_08725 [Collinsella sp. An2]
MMCERSSVGAYDLHNHSVFSDGSCTVDELIAQARSAGLAGVAVTDHDSLSQLSAVRACACAAGYPVLAGVEVSAVCAATGRKVHILGFGLEATPDGSGPLERMVASTLHARAANTLWQAWTIKHAMDAGADPLEGLATVGVAEVDRCDPDFSLDAVARACAAGTAPYKQHIMEALTHLTYTDTAYQPIYRSLFRGRGIAVSDISYPEATDAVRAIREQGGVPVLAHPGQMDSWSIVPDLVTAGLMGIEAFHPDHGPAEERRARELATEYGLFVTGGSDYHGRNGASPKVGERFVYPDEAGERVAELFAREAALA